MNFLVHWTYSRFQGDSSELCCLCSIKLIVGENWAENHCDRRSKKRDRSTIYCVLKFRIFRFIRRLKELQKETDANRESFMEYRRKLAESDSSPSDNEENLRPRPSVSTFNASQVN